MEECEICGFKHRTIVWEDIDGITRCKICRHTIRYGRYIKDDYEEEIADESEEYTDQWKMILLEYS